MTKRKRRLLGVVNVMGLIGEPVTCWTLAPYVGREVHWVLSDFQALQRKGLVEPVGWEPLALQPEGQPRRRTYRLTEKGRLTCTRQETFGAKLMRRRDSAE